MNSYTQHIAQKMISARSEVMKLLNWDEIQYSEFQYKMGCQYLQSYIPECPQQIDELIESRIFWNWWKNEWLFRDTALISTDIAKVKRSTILQIYLSTNDAEALRYEIYPNGVVLNNRYAEMIRNIQKVA